MMGTGRALLITSLVAGVHSLVLVGWSINPAANRQDKVLTAALLPRQEDELREPPAPPPAPPAAPANVMTLAKRRADAPPLLHNAFAPAVALDAQTPVAPVAPPALLAVPAPAAVAPQASVPAGASSPADTGAAAAPTTQPTTPWRPTGAAAASAKAEATSGSPEPTPSSRVELPAIHADYLQNPKPPYPPLSKRLGEQGRVLVRVLIGSDGNAQKAEIQLSSGFERLDQAALAAAMRWRYLPGRRGGTPETMWFTAPITFALE